MALVPNDDSASSCNVSVSADDAPSTLSSQQLSCPFEGLNIDDKSDLALACCASSSDGDETDETKSGSTDGSRVDDDVKLPVAMTPEEVECVISSFQSFSKEAKRAIGESAIRRVMAIFPETRNLWGVSNSHHLEASNDTWRIMMMGTVFLGGIERLALRLPDPARLRRCCIALKTSHQQRYNVSPQQLTLTLNIFEAILLERLRTQHNHANDSDIGHQSEESNSSTNKDKNPVQTQTECPKCIAWEKYFKSLNIILKEDQQ